MANMEPKPLTMESTDKPAIAVKAKAREKTTAQLIGSTNDPSWRRRQPLFILLALVGAGIYWFSHWDSERRPHHLLRPNVLPDFVITDFTTRAYDETGSLSYQLSAHKLTHYEQTDEAFLQQPHFRVAPSGTQNGWKATAEKGIAFNAGEHGRHISLQNTVKLDSDGPTTTAYHITTDVLDLYPDIKLARTESPVRITQASHRLDSEGLRADWGRGELLLQNEVHSHYDVTTR